MTAQEKEKILEEAGFEELIFISKWLFLWFNEITPVNTLYFIKGIKNPMKLMSLAPTKQGFVSDGRFILEVDGQIWIKYLNNG